MPLILPLIMYINVFAPSKERLRERKSNRLSIILSKKISPSSFVARSDFDALSFANLQISRILVSTANCFSIFIAWKCSDDDNAMN